MSNKQNTPGVERRRFRPYPEYKDSGVRWLGKIPAHWDIARIKEQFCIVNGSTPSSSDPSFWDGDIVWVTPDDLGELHVSRLGDSRRKITEEGYKSCGTSIVPKGSIVVSTRAPIGYVAIATTNLCTNQGCKSLVPKRSLSTGFFYYQLSSAKNELESRGEGSTFKEISKDKLGLIILTKPPEPDQHSIAFFLDCETAKIDSLIEKKERLIELLQENRTALITQAVTKGLDPTVPMKDSGVEWLGKIPAHWEVVSLKRRTKRIQTGTTPPTGETQYYEEGSIPWYGPGSFAEDLPLQEPVKFISDSALRDGVARIFEAHSSVIVTIGATIGKVAFMEQPGSCNQQITGVTFDFHQVFPRYGAYQLKSLERVLRGIAPNTTLPIIDQEEVGYLPFIVPPATEQEPIAVFLDRETAKIDSLVVKVQEAIDRLREYRTALISAAVTGEIDVREA